MKNSSRTTKGQFKDGTSGNPAGRPVGSRNKVTLACEELLEGEAEELIRTLVEKAKGGSIQALGLCLDRLVPARKERCINLESRPISSLQDLPVHFQDVVAAIAAGRITPGDGESLSNVLTSHAQAMERVEFDRRIAELEANAEDVKSYRAELIEFVKNGELGKPVDRKGPVL
jgi:hypothetical protein